MDLSEVQELVSMAVRSGAFNLSEPVMAIITDDRHDVVYAYEVKDVKVDEKTGRLAVMLG